MPIYALLCPRCGVKDSMFRKIEGRDNLPSCACGTTFERVISVPMIAPDLAPYQSPNGGHWVSGKRERIEDLRRSGAIAWEKGMEKDIARTREYRKEEAFKPLADAVDKTVRDLVVAGKLEN
jgi:hypothetical protein